MWGDTSSYFSINHDLSGVRTVQNQGISVRKDTGIYLAGQITLLIWLFPSASGKEHKKNIK